METGCSGTKFYSDICDLRWRICFRSTKFSVGLQQRIDKIDWKKKYYKSCKTNTLSMRCVVSSLCTRQSRDRELKRWIYIWKVAQLKKTDQKHPKYGNILSYIQWGTVFAATCVSVIWSGIGALRLWRSIWRHVVGAKHVVGAVSLTRRKGTQQQVKSHKTHMSCI